MDEPNPFASPQTPPIAGEPGSEEEVSARVVGLMAETRGWVLVLAVLGLVVSVAFAALLSWSFYAEAGLQRDPNMLAVAITSVLVCVFVTVPSLLLMFYASRAGRFSRTRAPDDLLDALRWHRRFWEIAGALTILALVLQIGAVLLRLA